MKTHSLILTCFVAAAMLGLLAGAALAVPLLPITTVNDWDNGSHVPGSPGTGNAPDTNGLGSVNYSFGIGQTEVTNAQYAQFLNDVAMTSDRYGLYNLSMFSDRRGGIGRTGFGTGASPWHYTPKPGYVNNPVTFVSWYDAVRYANYLSNKAQGVPLSTEKGSYAIAFGGKDSGVVKVPTVAQRVLWSDPLKFGLPYKDYYLLPTENEWYKAAYYKGGSLHAGYWNFPTQSNAPPKSELPPGTAKNGSANYTNSGTPLDAVKFTTPVGAYVYKPSTSAYGTYDQAGNVWEWDEQPYLFGTVRGMRGGSYSNWSLSAKASWIGGAGIASLGYPDVGFRIVLVPEPSALAMLLGCAVWGLIWWFRRK